MLGIDDDDDDDVDDDDVRLEANATIAFRLRPAIQACVR